MHEPRAGVVRLERHDHVPVQGHRGDISSWWVRECQVHRVVERAESLRDDKVVVAVEVHGVGSVAVRNVLNPKVHPLVRHAERDGVVVGEPLLRRVARVGPRRVVLVDHQVGGRGEVDPDVRAVEGEQEPGGHGDEAIVQVQKGNGVWGRDVQAHVRDEFVVRFVLALRAVLGGWVGCRGQGGGVCASVAYDAERVVPCVVVAAGTLPDGSEPIVVRGCVGFDDHVVPLAHGDDETIGCVGFEGDKIHGDDRQVVAVNCETEV